VLDHSSDDLLAHGLLSDVGATLNAGALDSQLVHLLRSTFHTRMPDADVSDDAALTRAVEQLAWRLRDRAESG
jgi:hypothetical protein